MDDRYYTVEGRARHEIKVKGSRFIAECEPVSSGEEVSGVLAGVRKREHAASHHCYAYRLGLGGEAVEKYSDDGEPSGTAGRPICDAICGRGLTQVVVIVTRYFGGTKLGTGGLVRAYGQAAAEALNRAGRAEQYITVRYRLTAGISWFDRIMNLLRRRDARSIDTEFTDRVSMVIEIRRSQGETLMREITQLTGGKAEIEPLEGPRVG